MVQNYENYWDESATISILIIEKNTFFALELKQLVFELNQEVLAVVDQPIKALEIIATQSPDLILMEVSICEALDGIILGEKIKHLPIPILYITTQNSNESYQAAKHANLIGYLVKPLDSHTLRSTLQLAIEKTYFLRYQQLLPPDRPLNHSLFKDFLFFKKEGIYLKIKLANIAFVKTRDNYCEAYTLQGELFTARIALEKMEQFLQPPLFLRTHRQYIVQIGQIESIDFKNGILRILDRTIPISRYKRKELDAVIQKVE